MKSIDLDREEKEIFDLVDGLILTEEDIMGLDDAGLEQLDDISLKRIKNKTMKKIQPKKKNSFFYKASACASSLVLVGTLFATTDVSAKLMSMLKFIPGANTVKVTEGDIFVLSEPVTITNDNQTLELKSIYVDNENDKIRVIARGVGESFEYVSVKLSSGEIIKLNNGYGILGDEWNLVFDNFEEDIDINVQDGEEIDVIFGMDNDVSIPVKLVLAEGISSINQLGPTAVQNNLSITAVPKVIDDETLKINLVTPNNAEISQFGSIVTSNFVKQTETDIFLMDKNGNKIYPSKIYDGSGKDPASEFLFKVDTKNFEDMKLEIPGIVTNYSVNRTVQIPIPTVGEAKEYTDWIVDIDGFKFKVLKVNRISNVKVEVDVEMVSDASLQEQLAAFTIDWLENSSYGGHFIMVDKDGKMIQFGFDLLDSSTEELPLYISHIHTLKKGPWVIDITKDSIE